MSRKLKWWTDASDDNVGQKVSDRDGNRPKYRETNVEQDTVPLLQRDGLRENQRFKELMKFGRSDSFNTLVSLWDKIVGVNSTSSSSHAQTEMRWR